jgi:hypothetical protein
VKTEAAVTSAISASSYKILQCQNPENHNVNNHRFENLKIYEIKSALRLDFVKICSILFCQCGAPLQYNFEELLNNLCVYIRVYAHTILVYSV